MPLFSSKDRSFVKLSTPNPEEFAFKVKVDMNQVGAGELVGKLNTPYSSFDFSKKLKPDGEGWSDYVFTSTEDCDAKHMWLFFAKNKTDEEKTTPFRSEPHFEDFTWNLVLLGIAVIPDEGFPQSTYAVSEGQKTLISAPRYYGREIFIPQITVGTKHVVDEFLSPTKFAIPAHVAPIPMPVNYEVLGVKREFPYCLHGDLFIQSTRTGTAQIVAGGTGGARSGAIEGYEFPATNFKEWRAHYVHDVQELRNGVWYRRRTRVIPPPTPKAVSQ